MTSRERIGTVKFFCTGFAGAITNQFTKCFSGGKASYAPAQILGRTQVSTSKSGELGSESQLKIRILAGT
jgi:hypothetical protein